MKYSLKTKISTPKAAETLDFYARVFQMKVVEEWDEPDDKGYILAFEGGESEALLEIYDVAKAHDFEGLSLQFKVENVGAFKALLPGDIESWGPVTRPWGAEYLYLTDPNGIMVIVYHGCF